MTELLKDEIAIVRYAVKRLAVGPGHDIGELELVGTIDQLEALIPAIETARRLRDEVKAVSKAHGFDAGEPRLTIDRKQVSASTAAIAYWEDE